MLALWLFIAAFGASALGGVLGMASGIFIVPALTLFFDVDIHVAIGASIVSVIACSCGSAAPLLKRRLTNVRLAVVLAKQMLVRRRDEIGSAMPDAKSLATSLRLHSSFPDHISGQEVHYRVGHVPLGMALMYGAGLVSALLGIGSGVLKIPAMDTALKLPIKVSSATSNFMIGVTAAASASAYFVRGDIDIGITGPIALGSVIGALVGARLLMSLPAEKLRIFFVVVLLVLAVQMLLSAFGIEISGGLE